MRAQAVATPLTGLEAGLHVVALAEGESLPSEFAGLPGSADVKTGFRRAAMLRGPGTVEITRGGETVASLGAPERLLALGAGKAADLDAERVRVLAALAAKQAASLDATTIAWSLPAGPPPAEAAAALVEGTALASYRFDRFHSPDPDSPPPPQLASLEIAAGEHADAIEAAVRSARVASLAANRARDLQNLPANVATPTYLADRARELAMEFEALSVEVMDRAEAAAKGLGGLVAVAAGTAQEPKLITMRYSGRGSGGVLGLVGKAVTFDSGGISIKPSAGMHEMKMDMSGGAAVIEAMGAIAELGLALDVVATVPATENMPSGTATRPGDIITQLNGKTVEVNNTDAEGRLILADALTWCVREQGADRLIDLATLTGAVLVALGSTYAALISNDDDWAATVGGACNSVGELAWRLPLHAEYKEITKGEVADLQNASAKRKAGTIYAGSFLEEFTDDVPWVHLDIAGTAWDTGREYWGDGATGFGVRSLVALAQRHAA